MSRADRCSQGNQDARALVGLTPPACGELTCTATGVQGARRPPALALPTTPIALGQATSGHSARTKVPAGADMVVKVKEPQPSEIAMLRRDQLLFTYLHLAADKTQTEGLLRSAPPVPPTKR